MCHLLVKTNRHCRTLTSDGIGQEGVGNSYQPAIIILVLPVILGNRLYLHLNNKTDSAFRMYPYTVLTKFIKTFIAMRLWSPKTKS